MNMLGIRQLALKLTHFLDLLLCAQRQLSGVELGPGHHRPLLDVRLMTLEDRVDFIVHVIVQFHFNKLGVLADWQVEQFLSKHVLFTLAIEGLICNLGFFKLVDTLFKRDCKRAWTARKVCFIDFDEFFLELLDITLSDFGEVALEFIELKVLALSHISQVFPGL